MMLVTNAAAAFTGGSAGLNARYRSDADKPSGGGTCKAGMADGANRIARTTANGDGATAALSKTPEITASD
jgi:hypothetical protein